MPHSFLPEFTHFLETSPCCFHAINNIKNILSEKQFIQLRENQKWKLRPGCSYFVMRNDASLIAFTLPVEDFHGMRIIASGGIRSIEDIAALKQLGLYGAITGKAMYHGTLDLKAAISLCREE